jgi:sugar phosphate isomerase/epimerase
MDELHLAAQLYTLRDHIRTPDEVATTFARVRALGYRSVQVSGMGPIAPERLREIAAANDLSICVTHTAFDRLLHDLDAVMADHRLWGCRFVGLGAMPDAYRGSLEGARRFVADIAPVARRLAAEGFRFVYHNHHFEFEKFDGVSSMDVLFQETDPRDFGFLMDTYWVQFAGHDPLKWIRKFAGRMDVIHLKDVMVHKGETVYGEVGSGNLDWDAIVAACRETGVTWYAVEQDDCPGDPFDSLAKSLRFLQKYL